jgi:hypothetical protein
MCWQAVFHEMEGPLSFLLYLYYGIFFPCVRPFPHIFDDPLVPSSDETEMGIGEIRVKGDEKAVHEIQGETKMIKCIFLICV